MGAVLIVALVAAATVEASRPPTRGEEKVIPTAFLNAHKHDEGYHLSTIREIRLSLIDSDWAAVLYRPPKRPSKKLSIDFFHLEREKWRYKRKAPDSIAADLRRPPERLLVDIRFRGSGVLRYDYVGDVAEGDTQRMHAGVDFSWDYEWRGVEISDFGTLPAPDRTLAEGTWEYSQADNFSQCTDSGALQPRFEGAIDVDRDGPLEAQVIFEDPRFTAPSSCTPYDLWNYVSGNLPSVRTNRFPTLHDVPTFPTEPVEQSESSSKCEERLDREETCTFTYSTTMTLTPR